MPSDPKLIASEGLETPANDIDIVCDFDGSGAAVVKRVRFHELDRAIGTEFTRFEYDPATTTLDVTKAAAIIGNLGTPGTPWDSIITIAATVTGLTTGRVVFVGAGSLLTDDAGFLYNAATDTVTVTGVTAGVPAIVRIENTDNTSAASHARLEIVVGGASGGDPNVRFTVAGVGNWMVGVDNTGDAFKIARNFQFDGTDEYFIITQAGIVTVEQGIEVGDLTSGRVTFATTSGRLTDSAAYLFDGTSVVTLAASISGGVVGHNWANTSNTANSRVRHIMRVGGASAGDAFMLMGVTGVGDWAIGVDNDASDAFVLSRAASLGTNNALSVSTGLIVTTPAGLEVGDLTATRVPFAGAAGRLTDSVNLVFTVAAGRLDVSASSPSGLGGNIRLFNTATAAINARTAITFVSQAVEMAQILAQQLSGATTGGLRFLTNSGGGITARWRIEEVGHLQPESADTYDIGTDAIGVRVAYLNVVEPQSSTAFILRHHGGSAVFTISVDGDVTLAAHNTAATGGDLTMSASDAVTLGAGGNVTIDAGNAIGVGANVGGSITLEPGFGISGGAAGDVVVNRASGAAALTVIGDTGNVLLANALEIDGALNHDGATVGIYNTTPVVQHTTTGQTAGFTAGVGASVLVDSTFTGGTGAAAYTIGDVVRALKLIGLMAA